MTTDILGLIDGALDDWDTSDDAMRWAPEPPLELRVLLIAWVLSVPESFVADANLTRLPQP